jgi:two-component system copper resistance phosphate regulon response regulator CusR
VNLLLIEDSERLRATLARGLRAEGYVVDVAGDGVEASAFLKAYTYDFLVLDLGLPRLDGYGVLRSLPAGGERPRVLVLSARDRVRDRVAALNAGADDYLVKPFAFDEVLAPSGVHPYPWKFRAVTIVAPVIWHADGPTKPTAHGPAPQ